MKREGRTQCDMARSHLTRVGTHVLRTHTFGCGEADALHLFPAHHRHVPPLLPPGPLAAPWVTPGPHPGPGLPHTGFSTRFPATFNIHGCRCCCLLASPSHRPWSRPGTPLAARSLERVTERTAGRDRGWSGVGWPSDRSAGAVSLFESQKAQRPRTCSGERL